jgi:hypothetical protein
VDLPAELDQFIVNFRHRQIMRTTVDSSHHKFGFWVTGVRRGVDKSSSTLRTDGWWVPTSRTQQAAAETWAQGIHTSGTRGHRQNHVVNRARHNSYRVKQPTDIGVRHPRPPTIDLVNLRMTA